MHSIRGSLYKNLTVEVEVEAINDDYYIQLRIQELRMCEQIRHTYYCEELFLVKHKSKHNCESAIFYNSSLTWCIQFANLSISIILQLHLVFLMMDHIYY